MKISDRIRTIRKELGLSQKAMARSLDIALSSYQYYERGERITPVDVIVRIVTLYGVSPSWILLGEGTARPDTRAGRDAGPCRLAYIKDIVRVLEETLQGMRIMLSPVKRAEVVGLVYEMTVGEEASYRGEARDAFISDCVVKLVRLAED